MTGVLLECTKVGNNRMTLPQAHFHAEVWAQIKNFHRTQE